MKALEKAIEAAKEVLDNEDATEEEVTEATEALNKAVKGLVDAEEPAEDKIAVAKVEADNIKDPKEVTVTFGEDEEVDAEALADTTITLTDAEGNAIPAKFSKLDKDGNAIYKAEEELTDAVKYTVTSEDLAIAKDTKVTAKVAPVYIADVTFLTTGVKEINDVQDIQLTYKDQYDEPIELSEENKDALTAGLKVTAQKENTSLMLDVKFKEGSKDIVELTIKPQQLKENDTFTVTITNEVKKEDKKELVLNKESEPIKVYAKGAQVVATSLTKPVVKKVDEKDPTEDLKSGDSFELTTTVYDQFSNKMENLAAGETGDKPAPVLQWQTSDPEVLALDSKDNKAKAVNGKNSTDFGMEIFAGKQGEATITVSTPDGLYSETFTVEVGQGKLASIVAKDQSVTVENKAKADGLVSVNEEAKDIKAEDKAKHALIEFQNSNESNIKVKAKDIDFEVEEKKDSEFKASDVTLEKVVDEEGYLTGVKVSTDRKALTDAEKKGNYEVGHNYTVKVKPANEKSEVDPAKFTVNSKINSEVTAIETATDVEFRAGSEMTPEEVTFKNKYGEIINVQAKNLEVTYSEKSGIEATLQTKTVKEGKEPAFTDISQPQESEELVHAIKYSSGAEKDATVNVILAIDKVSKLVNVKVNESAAIASIDLGEDVKDLIAGKEATLLPVTVKDQDGNVKNVTTNELQITVDPEDKEDKKVFTLVSYGKDKDGNLVEIPEENTENIKALGVAVKVNTASLEGHSTTTYEVTVDNKEAADSKDLAKDTIEVTIQANPALKVFNVSTETPTMTTNGEIEVLIKPEDQYGEFIEIDPETVAINEDAEYVELEKVTEVKETVKGKDGQGDSTKVVAYKAILKAKGKDGSETVEFKIGEDNKVAAQKLDVTVTGLDKVTEVEVVADQDEYITADADQEVQLTAIGKDEEGNQVALEANGLTWTIEKVVDAEGNEYKLEGDKYIFKPEKGDAKTLDVSIDKDGKLTAPQGASVSVTVKSETNALVAGEKTITFKGEPRKFVEGLKVATVADKDAEELEDKGLVITFKDVKDAAPVTLTFSGIDQYGDVFDIKDKVDARVVNESVATADAQDATGDEIASTLTVTPGKVSGETTLNVIYGEETLPIKVKVSEEVANEVKATEAATETVNALTTVKGALADSVDQDEINAAQALVDTLSEENKTKAELQDKIDAAQELLDEATVSAVKAELKAEAEKYKGEATIAKTVNAAEAVTETVKALNEGQTAAEGIEVTAAVQQDAQYLSVDQDGKVTLKEQNATGKDVTETVTLTFTKDDQTETKDVTVTIEPTAASVVKAELKAEAKKYKGEATIAKTVNAAEAVTETVKVLNEGQTAAEGIEVTAAVQQDAQYLSVDQDGKVIKLAKQNDTDKAVTETVTLTFTKDNQTETKDVTVTIEPQNNEG